MAVDERIHAILDDFTRHDPGRSVALHCWQDDQLSGGIKADIPRPAASVIKIATVMALFDLGCTERVDLSELVSVHELNGTRYCSILKAFDPDRRLSLREIAALSLITSDNPATVYVMSRLSDADIASVLAAAGCSEFAACAAGFSEPELGRANRANQLTANDAIRLFQHLASQPHYKPIVTFLENNLRNARIPALLPDNAIVAHKTGSLDGVVNDAGIVSRNGRAFTIAFLCDQQSDPIVTQNDMSACSLRLFELLIGNA